MIKKPVTAAQVGRLAGVSQSAVSRAFNPGTSISPRMRQKVLRAAEELGYQPNLIARSLATRRSNIIGLAIASLENPFYALLVKELGQALRPSGRHLLLFPPDPQTDTDPSIEEVLRYQVDALILASTTLTSDLAARCRSMGVPILLLNRTTPLGSVSTVTGENARGAAAIAAFLIAGGHRRIAYLAGLETASTSRDREAALVKALAAGGHTLFARITGDYSFERAAAATRTLLARKRRPDAIFAANDYMAMAALEVARAEFGLSVPGDLSVVGFDGIGESGHLGSEITSYSQPVPAFAREAIALLDRLDENPDAPPRRRVVKGELLVRGTARVPRTGVVTVAGRSIWRPERAPK
jgi:DNA-binding LacI/PurR family transcriptional regulator